MTMNKVVYSKMYTMLFCLFSTSSVSYKPIIFKRHVSGHQKSTNLIVVVLKIILDHYESIKINY